MLGQSLVAAYWAKLSFMVLGENIVSFLNKKQKPPLMQVVCEL
jgi:hypothetical protein